MQAWACEIVFREHSIMLSEDALNILELLTVLHGIAARSLWLCFRLALLAVQADCFTSVFAK